MNIAGIVDREYDTFDEMTPIAKLRGEFEDPSRKALMITDADGFSGIVTRRDVLSSNEQSMRKARSLCRAVPTVASDEDVRETARLMIAGDTRSLPVMEDDDLVGVVRADDLLVHVQSNLSALDAEDVATSDVVSVTPTTSLGKALATFRTERIEHLPVVTGEDVVGIVSLFDVIAFVTRELHRSQGGDADGRMHKSTGGHHGGMGAREGESDDMLSLPVRNVMVETIGTTAPGRSLDAVLETMLEHDASSALVVDDGSLAGIVTKTDLLESLTWTEDERFPIQLFGAELLTDLTREDVGKRVEDAARKYRAMNVFEAKVHLHEHDEMLRGISLILARVRLYTDKGMFVASGEGYGDRHAISLALNAVERQILEGKTYGQSKKSSDGVSPEKIYGWVLS